MFDRRTLKLFAFLFSVVASSVVCAGEQDIERLQDLEEDDATRVAETVQAIHLTETAVAGLPPAPTDTPIPPTETPTEPPPTLTPTATLDLSALAALLHTDPAGDTQLCSSGAGVEDPAVDILTVEFYEPAAVGSDWTGWLARIGLGAPANETYANDYSAAVRAAYASPGDQAYTFIINEIHDTTTKVGQYDPTTGVVVTGTQTTSYIDDSGYVWFQLPPEVIVLQVASFHTPTANLPPEQTRCDVAPTTGAFTLDLP
jgi:hypothetical protein